MHDCWRVFYLDLNSLNKLTKCGQLPGQVVQRTLINHFSGLRINFVLNHAAHKFRLVHHHCIEENQNLAQVILTARAANHAH